MPTVVNVANEIIVTPDEPGLYVQYTADLDVTVRYEFDTVLESWDYRATHVMLKYANGSRSMVPWTSIFQIIIVPKSEIEEDVSTES